MDYRRFQVNRIPIPHLCFAVEWHKKVLEFIIFHFGDFDALIGNNQLKEPVTNFLYK